MGVLSSVSKWTGCIDCATGKYPLLRYDSIRLSLSCIACLQARDSYRWRFKPVSCLRSCVGLRRFKSLSCVRVLCGTEEI